VGHSTGPSLLLTQLLPPPGRRGVAGCLATNRGAAAAAAVCSAERVRLRLWRIACAP
jgi:hypothetical protein